MRATQIPVGKDFIILDVALNQETGKRLIDMELTRWTKARVVRKNLLRGPLQIRVRGYDISLDWALAENIWGELVERN